MLLAAGASTRFGSPKALARLGSSTLVDLAVQRARSVVGEDFTLILGAYAAAIRRTITLPEQQIACHDAWNEGLAASLKYALSRVPLHSPAALIMLVDQPAISTDDLNSLITAWQMNPATAAAAYYAGDIGVPCILPRRFFLQAQTLAGDRGAKALLRQITNISRVTMGNAAYDVDTSEDLARVAEYLKR